MSCTFRAARSPKSAKPCRSKRSRAWDARQRPAPRSRVSGRVFRAPSTRGGLRRWVCGEQEPLGEHQRLPPNLRRVAVASTQALRALAQREHATIVHRAQLMVDVDATLDAEP